MSLLQRLVSLFSAHEAPPPQEIRVVPCTGLDVAARAVVLTTGLVIDARLDSKTLEQTLAKLIEHKFPRAGARLAYRNGVYEFHVPRTFAAGTPPFAFTVEDHPEPYRSPTRPELPIHRPASAQPSVQPLPALEVYFRSRECPTTLAGFLVPNMPSLHVHVAVFDDLTYIGLTSSHICFDALGTRTLLYAWTRLLMGDALDTIQGMEWDTAPFDAFTGPPVVAHPHGWFDLGFFSQLYFALRLLWPIAKDPKEVVHIVRVPKVFLDDAKREIMDDLKRQGSSEWVGSSDVLMAWWLKTVYSHRRPDDTTPIHVHFPADLRDKPIFAGAAALPTPYIHNAVLGIPIPPLPANAFSGARLGALALHIRRAVLAFDADPAQIAADLRWRCTHPAKALFPCPPRGEYTGQTNWRKARFGALDFSGACRGATRGPGARGRVVFCVGLSSSRTRVPYRGNGIVLMEDEDAVWMRQVRGAKDWESIRRSGTVAFS
ncbi:hypothetical protein B0H15DRAFT_944350 [Mycena belliarum]|uniref:Uncharacterized protein n=1 Tax=Mycena belliarum TaxID=1033014 RepID=A0AAD6XU43_9AGAR|nr:hypothetical protein B0H15DRAFT_944350 [Mycena belliae]